MFGNFVLEGMLSIRYWNYGIGIHLLLSPQRGPTVFTWGPRNSTAVDQQILLIRNLYCILDSLELFTALKMYCHVLLVIKTDCSHLNIL